MFKRILISFITCLLLLRFIPYEIAASNEIIVLAIFETNEEKSTWLKSIDKQNIRCEFDQVFYGATILATKEELEKWREDGLFIQTLSNSIKAINDSNFTIIGVPQIHRELDKGKQYITGKGIKVGVIDTGIDYDHRDLKRNYTGGKDLVDNDDDPMETIENKETTTSHGTHVAGIIAANGKMIGVAPNAEIISYRALGPKGHGTTEQILAAIEKAIIDKVDILNLSLGSNVNGPDLPLCIALNKAVAEGITVVVAAGNDGPNMWTVGNPGTASEVITVGASTPKQQIPFIIVDRKEIAILPMMKSKQWLDERSYPIVDFKKGKETEFISLRGKIALIERGEIPFTEKAKNAAMNGAVACLIYNNEKGMLEGGLQETVDIPVYSLSKEDGAWLKAQLIEDPNLLIRSKWIERSDEIATFSSRGPVTNQFYIKPDVVAPGVAIQSTVPDGYAPMQGTSMAAPHVAGAAALLKQANPKWTPQQIKSALMNTAKRLKSPSGQFYKVYEQGAGRIQLEEALQTKSFITPSSLHFPLEKEWRRVSLEVENYSETEQRYSFLQPQKMRGIEWRVPTSFYLKPKEKKQIEVLVKVDDQLDVEMIEGYLELQSSEQLLTLPYLIVITEPSYPRITGINFTIDEKTKALKFEAYFPEEVEELSIVLLDIDQLLIKKYLLWEKNLSRGEFNTELTNCVEFVNDKILVKIFLKSKNMNWEEQIILQL